ncbi:hypothetical protein ONZ51_g4038 [Trametes cubensis]|uniref:DUF6534 domain-containing protein n=1 Tax=Trametes cubensis TaxID=1111947 RepID=A0AAD7XF25_9APHY|nr:hypothetical protein ONZ51_g4038 [Trametes cubensis]
MSTPNPPLSQASYIFFFAVYIISTTQMNLPLTAQSGLAAFWETLGVVALAVIIGLMLYGLTLHQVYRYFKMYPKDLPCHKTFVAVVLALETWHTILWLVAGYHYLLQVRFTDISRVEGHWSVRLSIVATALTVAATEGFYAWRVYLLGPQCLKWLVIPLVVLLLVCKGPFLATRVAADANFDTVLPRDQQQESKLAASYGLASATDVALAVTLVFLFHRSRVGLPRTNTILDILIKYTINTGILTSMLAFIFAIVLPGNLIYAGFSIIGTKRTFEIPAFTRIVYANSVLAVLNSRNSIINRVHVIGDEAPSIDLPSLRQNVSMENEIREQGNIVHSPIVTEARAPRVSIHISILDSTVLTRTTDIFVQLRYVPDQSLFSCGQLVRIHALRTGFEDQ